MDRLKLLDFHLALVCTKAGARYKGLSADGKLLRFDNPLLPTPRAIHELPTEEASVVSVRAVIEAGRFKHFESAPIEEVSSSGAYAQEDLEVER